MTGTKINSNPIPRCIKCNDNYYVDVIGTAPAWEVKTDRTIQIPLYKCSKCKSEFT